MIGGTLSRLFTNAGHDVFVSNSRGPESLKELEATLGPRVKAVTSKEAVVHGDVVVLALPWRNRQELPAAKLFERKIVVDTTNPYKPEVLESTISETARQAKRSRSLYREHGW